MNKAEEFLDKIGIDNKDVIILLEELLESAYLTGYNSSSNEDRGYDDIKFEDWLKT